jgi:hypothetical protein
MLTTMRTHLTAYGARRVRQDLATSGRDVRSYHRRAPAADGDLQAICAATSRQREC